MNMVVFPDKRKVFDFAFLNGSVRIYLRQKFFQIVGGDNFLQLFHSVNVEGVVYPSSFSITHPNIDRFFGQRSRLIDQPFEKTLCETERSWNVVKSVETSSPVFLS